MNVTQALFFQSKVPIIYWGECVSTATFLINRLPSPVLKFKTPYQLLFGKAPDYASLRVFSYLCYAFSLLVGHTKFEARVVPTVFIGYPIGYKGYKLLNLSTRQIFISRDVEFFEDIFPFHNDHLHNTNPSPTSDVVLPIP